MSSTPPGRRLQPLLHDLVACVAAPTQAWSGADGQVRAQGARASSTPTCGCCAEAVLTVDGREPEGIAVTRAGRRRGALRRPGPPARRRHARPDRAGRAGAPRCRPDGVDEELRLVSTASEPVDAPSSSSAGRRPGRPRAGQGRRAARAAAPTVARTARARLVGRRRSPSRCDAGDAEVVVDGPARPAALAGRRWRPRESWRAAGACAPATRRPSWSPPRAGPRWDDVVVEADDRRLGRAGRAPAWTTCPALRHGAGRATPATTFLAAGAPWFFTLFGRDSLWAARMLLPLGTELAAGTLRVLAAPPGHPASTRRPPRQPGKILHELRRAAFTSTTATACVLPPVYYGTVDATPLWVCLLHDAWRWGMPEEEVEALLPAPGGGARPGWASTATPTATASSSTSTAPARGLANQGWKDSGDSRAVRDGALAEPPIALCEVQGYAYEAAAGGAALLDAFGRPGARPLAGVGGRPGRAVPRARSGSRTHAGPLPGHRPRRRQARRSTA